MGETASEVKILKEKINLMLEGNIRPLGEFGELIAQRHYRQLGFSIVGTNYFNRRGRRQGEIDFIASSRNILAFVEVKTRTNSPGAYQSAVEAITMVKRRRLFKAIRWYLADNPPGAGQSLRVDVCVVLLDKSAISVKILTNAVEDLY